MVKVIKNNDISEILEKDFAIADFNAVWCGPCRMLGPVLNEISNERSDAAFYGIDSDDNADIAEEYEIQSIPTLIAFKNGKEVGRTVGAAQCRRSKHNIPFRQKAQRPSGNCSRADKLMFAE